MRQHFVTTDWLFLSKRQLRVVILNGIAILQRNSWERMLTKRNTKWWHRGNFGNPGRNTKTLPMVLKIFVKVKKFFGSIFTKRSMVEINPHTGSMSRSKKRIRKRKLGKQSHPCRIKFLCCWLLRVYCTVVCYKII